MNPTIRTLPAAFRELAIGADDSAPAWLKQWRQPRLDELAALPLPTRRTESWRYSSRRLVIAETTAHVAAPAFAGTAPATGLHVAFSNGRFDHNASRLPQQAGVTCKALSQLAPGEAQQVSDKLGASTATSNQPFGALLDGRLQDGLYLKLDAGVRLEAPLNVTHVASGDTGSCVIRLVVELGTGAELTLIESYRGAMTSGGLTGSAGIFHLADQAGLTHIRLGFENEAQQHLAGTTVRLNRNSQFHGHYLGFGGALRRHDLSVRLEGAGAEATVDGVYVTRGDQHHDVRLEVEHVAPHCTSRETWRGLAGGTSQAVFNGRILIHRDAQKSNAELSNKNLLLSNGAEIDTKPELEIYADDVKCAHGATVGQLDHESLFYFTSRGIGRAEARQLLSLAFVQELVHQLPVEAIREQVEAELASFVASAFAETRA